MSTPSATSFFRVDASTNYEDHEVKEKKSSYNKDSQVTLARNTVVSIKTCITVQFHNCNHKQLNKWPQNIHRGFMLA